MTMTPPPVPGTQRSGCSSFAIGCGVVALIVVLILVGVLVWLFLPGGKRIEVRAVVGPDAVAMVHLTDCAEDPGVVAFTEDLSRIMRDAQRHNLEQQLPGKLRGLGDLAMLSQSNWKPSYLPEAVCSVEDLAESNRTFVVGAGLDGLPKLFTLPFRIAIKNGGSSGGVVNYRNQDLMDTHDGAVTFFGSSVVFATDLDTLRGAADRVLDGAPAQPLLELAPPSYADHWDLYGILQNRDAALAGVVRELGEDMESLPVSTAAITDGWFGIDVASADQIRAELIINCVDEAAAKGVMTYLREYLERELAQLEDPMVDIVINGECEGSRAIITLDVVGVSRLIEHRIQASMEK